MSMKMKRQIENRFFLNPKTCTGRIQVKTSNWINLKLEKNYIQSFPLCLLSNKVVVLKVHLRTVRLICLMF